MNTYFDTLTGRLLGDRSILQPRPVSRFEPTARTVNPRLEEVSSYTAESEEAEGVLNQRPIVEPLVQPQEKASASRPRASVEERLSQVVQKLPVPDEPNPFQPSNLNPPAVPDSEAILPSQTSPSRPNPPEASGSEAPSLTQGGPKAGVNQPLAIIPQSQATQSSSAKGPASGRIKSQKLNHSEISPLQQDSEVDLSESSADRATQTQLLNRRLLAEIEAGREAISRTKKNSTSTNRFDEESSSLSQVAPEPVKLISPRERLLQSPKKIPSSSVSAASNQTTPLPPPIQVTIGRIEVKAVSPPPAPTRQPATPIAPALSLEEYLKQREARR